MIKKIVAIGVILLGVSLSAMSVQASGMKIQIGDKMLESGVSSIQKNGVTMLPLRIIAENLNAVVEYDNKTGKISIIKNEKCITLHIGALEGEVNGTRIKLQEPPQIYNGVTMIPLRFIAENLDCQVEYKAEQMEICIKEVNEKSNTLPSGTSYLGDEKDGLAHGYGMQTDASGNNVLGKFEKGVPNGYCIMFEQDYTYVGKVEKGIPEGYGYIVYATDKEEMIKGEKTRVFSYMGQMKEGKPHGYGVVEIYDNNSLKVAYVPATYKDGKKVADTVAIEATGVNGEKYTIEDLIKMRRESPITIGKNGVIRLDEPMEDQVTCELTDVYYKGIGIFENGMGFEKYTEQMQFYVGKIKIKEGVIERLRESTMLEGILIMPQQEIMMGDWKEDGILESGCKMTAENIYIGDTDKNGEITDGIFLSMKDGMQWGIIKK